MKRILIVLVALCCLCGAALAEVDTAALEALPDMSVYLDDDNTTLVIRPVDQPYFGEITGGAWDVCAYVDYVEDADTDLTLLRLSIATESAEPLYADSLILTVGRQRWRFAVSARATEYDMVYQEDYVICLTDVSLPLLSALIKAKQDTLTFTLISEREQWQGTLSIPAADLKAMYDTYVRLGGSTQNLARANDKWPCVVE